MRRWSVLIVALWMVACSSASAPTKAVEVSGESIDALGKLFVSTATAFTQGCINKVYTVAQCDAFRTFGQRFQMSFPVAKDAWTAASVSGNQAALNQQATALTQLSNDLAPFAALITGGK